MYRYASECWFCKLEDEMVNRGGSPGWCAEHAKVFDLNMHNECYRCRKLKIKLSEYAQEQMKVREYKYHVMKQAVKEIDKHCDESCSNCDKHIGYDEWLCYCSLCPDCYVQIPEEEIERLDEEIKKRALEYQNQIQKEKQNQISLR